MHVHEVRLQVATLSGCSRWFNQWLITISAVPAYIPTQSPEEDWSDHMQIHQADSPLYVWPDVWSADLHLLIKSMVIHDTECPYWGQVSLNNTNQTKPISSTVLFFSLSVCFQLLDYSILPVIGSTALMAQILWWKFLPLDVDFMNKNAVAANLIFHSQNSVVHKSQFAICTYGMLNKGRLLIT